MIGVPEIYKQNHEYMKSYCKVIFLGFSCHFSFVSEYGWSRAESEKASREGQEVTAGKEFR